MNFEEYRHYIIPPVEEFAAGIAIDYETISKWGLSKFMVPIQSMIKQSLEIEGCTQIDPSITYYGVDSDGKLKSYDVNENKLRSVEYSFTIPVRENYITMNPNDITDDIMKDWTSAISTRVLPIIQNAVQASTIEKFDQDPNVNCFLHIYSGKIDFYPISDLDCFSTVQWNDIAMNEFLKIYKSKDRDNYDLRRIYRTWCIDMALPTTTLLSYYLGYSNGDILYTSFDTSLPDIITNLWSTYLINMVRHKAKVIIVP